MDRLISDELHEALDVEPPDISLRTRVMSSLPVYETTPERFASPTFRWVTGSLAALLGAAVVAGLLFSHSAASRGAHDRSPATRSVGSITTYAVPPFIGAITSGADGNLWVLRAAGPNGIDSRVYRVTTSGGLTAYNVTGYPWDITAGPDGNIWFTEVADTQNTASGARTNTVGKIGKITPSGALTEYTIPSPGAQPSGIASGPDGNLWVTDPGTNRVIKVTTSGVMTEYRIPTANSDPAKIAAGPDGSLWFAERNGGNLAKVTTSGVITEFKLPGQLDEPVGVTAGPDGNMWITEGSRLPGGPGKVARVTTSGSFTEYAIPISKVVGSARPFREPQPGLLIVGPDRNLWFTAGSNLDSVTTSGVFSQYVVPTAIGPGVLGGIAAGPDGNIWFTVYALAQSSHYIGNLAI